MMSVEQINEVQFGRDSFLSYQRNGKDYPPSTQRSRPICDITINSYDAICTSTFVHAVSQAHEQFEDLSRFVRLWAKSRNINSRPHGTFSGYALQMLVLHYVANVAKVFPLKRIQQRDSISWIERRRDMSLLNRYIKQSMKGEREWDELTANRVFSWSPESLGRWADATRRFTRKPSVNEVNEASDSDVS
eukprot:GHVN01000731.1.p1 GENE.GHVN01000731.1~~GHVN01000731.1.p1  ORF type:complete len:190 (+),score=20.89 GHVN01000731.1:288-857(+)